MTRLAIDLFCGRGGWARGLIAAGWEVIGIDLDPSHARHYPGTFLVADVSRMSGRRWREVGLIVGSPPCQTYSYMAMPFSRGKRLAEEYRSGERSVHQLNALFRACFRLQREASRAAGRRVPLVVENVKGAQPWVGPAKARFGSFYLWGDVPEELPHASHRKGLGGSWFGGTRGDPRACKASAAAATKKHGIKQPLGTAAAWFRQGAAQHSSRSTARKEASAIIAMIPFDLARAVGESFAPPGSHTANLDSIARLAA